MSDLQRAGSYILLKKIAVGGMAELYKAKKSGEKGFEKLFAVKMILPHLAENEEFISMLVDEAKVAALLDHPNIVRIYDLGKTETSYFIVMEYVRGRDLRKVLTRAAKAGTPLSLKDACYITACTLAGLNNAHKKKSRGQDLHIVHRDVSPQNVIMSYEGEVKVLDFGIAKAATQSVETKAGVLKGKVSYMSPEQARGKPLDGRSDIFSAGTVLYEMLVGKKLFAGESDINTLKRVWAARVEPLPTAINKDIPNELESILLKSLARDPDKRYQTAGEMEDALLDFMRREGFSSDANSLGRYMRELFKLEFEAETKEDEELHGADLPEEAHGDAPEVGYTMTKTPMPDSYVFEEAMRQAQAQAVAQPPAPEPSEAPAPEPTIPKLSAAPQQEASYTSLSPEPAPAPPTPPASSSTNGKLIAVAAALLIVVAGAWFGLRRVGNAVAPPQTQPGVEAVPQEAAAPASEAVKGRKKSRNKATGDEKGRTRMSPVPDRAIEPSSANGGRSNHDNQRQAEPPPRQSRTRAAISSEPSGASVYLDGRSAGTTPLDVDALDPYHRYSVKVVKDGYDTWSGEFSVSPGKTERLHARLTMSGRDNGDIWKDPFPKSPGRNRSR